ncbi:MAG: hypothetical protein CMA81_07835 [Euryarchaeota archaeon]|nr:hypothetical protein [Euryarchaeota archaeon]
MNNWKSLHAYAKWSTLLIDTIEGYLVGKMMIIMPFSIEKMGLPNIYHWFRLFTNTNYMQLNVQYFS